MATLLPIQIGHVFGVWVELPTLLATATTGIGARFQLPVDTWTDSGTGVAINRSLTANAYRGLTLTLTSTGGFTGTLNVWVSLALAPAAFATGNPPSQTGIRVATPTIPGNGAQQIPLSFSTTAAGTDFQTLYTYLSQQGWSGVLALSIFTQVGNLVATTSSVSLLTTPLPEFTGLGNAPPGPARADRCPRCGTPSLRETWIRDGYTKTLVCPQCYDPPEREPRSWTPEAPPISED